MQAREEASERVKEVEREQRQGSTGKVAAAGSGDKAKRAVARSGQLVKLQALKHKVPTMVHSYHSHDALA